MAQPARNTLKNSFKEPKKEEKQPIAPTQKVEKPKVKTPPKPVTEKPLAKKVAWIKKLPDYFWFVYTEEFHKTVGLILLLVAIYLCIAFISFPFTWEADYSKVVGDLSNPETTVTNWLGKLGAFISHLFIYKWFGIASFIFPLLAFITGTHITFNIGDFNFRKIYSYSLFALLFISITLGFLINNPSYLYLGGAYGYTMSGVLVNILGNIGTALTIFFALIVFLVVNFNIPLNPATWLDWMKKDEDEEKIIANEIDSNIEEELNNITPPVAPIASEIANTFKEKTTLETEEKPVEVTEEDARHEIETPDEVSLELNVTTTEEPQVETDPEVISEAPIELELATTVPVKPSASLDSDVEFTVEQAEVKEEELSAKEVAKALTSNVGEYDPTLDLASYQFPNIDLLDTYGAGTQKPVDQEELNANKDKILKTLSDYKIEIDKIKATVGPTVTLYEIVPAAGVRISKIKNLEDDIALSLAALGIRIIAPIPGKGTIGIEVPNLNAEIVPMRSILSSEKFQNSEMELPIGLGKTISNETFIYDLAKMPHLLMAGATGQGKSVGLNAILVSLLYKKHPSQVKLILVDPKKVELTLFNKIERHFLAKLPDGEDAIITDTTKVVHTLNSLCIEMDTRYDLLKDAQVRNIKEYNHKFITRRLNPNNGHKFLPYIVLVVDEFADLIMTAGKEVETPIARLAQLARAIGIHLIIATQRPSVNIITGTIKANFPARIAFRVTSKIDSRTILDAGGADQLIGRGDMLLSTGNDIIRLQCALVDTPEVERICEFIGEQRGYPDAYFLPEYIDENGDGAAKDMDMSDNDVLFEQAAEIVVTTQQGSTSLLQRRLKLGYNRAGRIIDQLEAAGIIGPFGGSKAREVLVADLFALEQFLKDLKEKN